MRQFAQEELQGVFAHDRPDRSFVVTSRQECLRQIWQLVGSDGDRKRIEAGSKCHALGTDGPQQMLKAAQDIVDLGPVDAVFDKAEPDHSPLVHDGALLENGKSGTILLTTEVLSPF